MPRLIPPSPSVLFGRGISAKLRNIMDNLLTEGYTRYNIYVTKTTSMDLSRDNLCGSIYQGRSDYHSIDITCLEGKILSGDQIVIQKITTLGSIQVHDVRVYRKYIFL